MFVFPPWKNIGSYPIDLRAKTGLVTGRNPVTPFPPGIYGGDRLGYARFAQGADATADFTVKSIVVAGSDFGTAA